MLGESPCIRIIICTGDTIYVINYYDINLMFAHRYSNNNNIRIYACRKTDVAWCKREKLAYLLKTALQGQPVLL